MFDQHNGLKTAQRLQFPFSVVEGFLPSVQEWKLNKALVVVSASANNQYFLKAAYDNYWPTFVMQKGFDEKEFTSWAGAEHFFVGQDLTSIEHWTGRVPYP